MLGIVVVDYKSVSQTIDYINRELSKLENSYKIAISCNEATGECLSLFQKFPNTEIVISEQFDKTKSVFVLPHNENLGFAKGNNSGAEFLIKNFNPDYLLFSNNDIVINGSDVVSQLIAKLNSDQSIGMIGPEVIGLDGKRQSPEPYVNLWNRYVWMYLSTPFLSKKRKRNLFQIDYSDKADKGFHYRIMGSFFLMRAKDFTDCGMMDPNTFLYAEEMILSERLANIGKSVYFDPSVTVIHAHGVTTGKHIPKRKNKLLQFDSDAYYYHTYKGYSKVSIKLCKFIYNIICHIKYK